MKVWLAEAVFWTHLFLIGCVMASGIWLSFWMVALVMALHRLQFLVFRGCVLSHLQDKLKPFPKGMGFLQYAWFRLTGHEISLRQENVLDAALVCVPLMVSLMK